MYIEIVKDSVKNRGEIINISDFGKHKWTECYISLFPFDIKILDYVKLNKTIKGYKGKHYCPMLYIDIDFDDDLKKSHEWTAEIIKRLNYIYKLPLDHINIYFSGAKGFHIGLHEKIFGGLDCREDNPQRIKQFVKEILEGIQGVDYSVYEPHRIFRVVNSINRKTNLYKIPIKHDEFFKGLDYILKKAKTKRKNFKKTPSDQIYVNKKLKTKLQSIEIKEDNNITNTENNRDFFTPPTAGDRNNKLYKQTCMLFDKSDFNKGTISSIIKSINKASEKPLKTFEVESIIESATQKTQKNKSNLYVADIAGWFEDWFDNVLPEKNKLNLFIKEWDDLFEGALRGKLMTIIGYGGTMKSLLAQNIVRKNIFKNNARCLYSSMEMSASELINRFIDMIVDDTDDNASRYLRKIAMEKSDDVKTIYQERISPFFSDKLQITQNGSMITDNYLELYNRLLETVGKTDVTVVDGLSMMGGKGTEVEKTIKHTAELKDYAKQTNQFVIAIVHTSRGEKITTRDASHLARGGEKILDNCDFYVYNSKIEKDDTIDDELYHDRVHCRLYDKRGTGQKIDKVLKINKMLHLDEIYKQEFFENYNL